MVLYNTHCPIKFIFVDLVELLFSLVYSDTARTYLDLFSFTCYRAKKKRFKVELIISL